MATLDLGDAALEINLRVKRQPRRRLRLRVGVPTDTTEQDRVVKGPPYHQPRASEGAVIAVDLQADKKVTLTGEWTDEVGNPVGAPDDATYAYTVDDPNVINLTDNGDGTAVAAAVGTPGTANVHGEAMGGGATLTGDLQIIVVAGLAERFNITAGEPEEVTPDQ